MRKTVLAVALAGATLVRPAAAYDDTQKQLAWERQQEQQRDRESGYPESGYSNGECGFGCKAFIVGALGVIAAIAAEQARKQRLQRQRVTY